MNIQHIWPEILTAPNMEYHPELSEADRRAVAIADGLSIWGGVMAGIKPPVEVGEAIVALVKIAGLKSGTPESFMAASEVLVGGFGNIFKSSMPNLNHAR